MDELVELILKPIFFVFRWVFKILMYFIVEVCHSYIGWAIGWLFFRMVSIGKNPKEGIWRDQDAGLLTNVLVTLTGFIIFAVLIIIFIMLIILS